MKPTKGYRQALKLVREFHDTRKLYTGRYIRFYAKNIKEMIDLYGCKTLLDYGSGKGQQWVTPFDWDGNGFADDTGLPTLQEHLGVEVVRYDPGVQGIDVLPERKFDIVICTQVLGAIPGADIPWVVDRMCSKADKAVFIGEAGGATKKRFFNDIKDILPGDWGYMDYVNAIIEGHRARPNLPLWFRWRSIKEVLRVFG